MSILNEIAKRTKERIEEQKFKVPLRELIAQQNSEAARKGEEKIRFLEALKKPGMFSTFGEKVIWPPKAPFSITSTLRPARRA